MRHLWRADYTDTYITTPGGQDRETNGATASALYHLDLGIQGKSEVTYQQRSGN